MASLAEDKALIVELGSYSIKIKVGTDDVGSLPNLEIRSQFGVPEDLLSTPADSTANSRPDLISDQDLENAFKNGRLLLGSQLTKHLSKCEQVEEDTPIKVFDTLTGNQVIDWFGLKLLLGYLLVCELEITLQENDSALLVSIPVNWPKVDLELLTQLCFENLNAPALYIIPQPLATIFGYGQINGLVIDFGYTSTKITPIIESCVVSYGHRTVQFGTKDVDDAILQSFLKDESITKAFSPKSIDLELIQYLREAGHLDFSEEEATDVEEGTSPKEDTTTVTIEYGGIKVEIQKAKLQVGEVMFSSKSESNDFLFSRHLFNSIFGVVEKCENEKRPLLWENIALSGGLSCSKGLSKRLEVELHKLLPLSENIGTGQSNVIKTANMPEYFSKWRGNPHLATMLGSTITAKFVFQDPKLHITRLDYSEFGPLIIHNKSG